MATKSKSCSPESIRGRIVNCDPPLLGEKSATIAWRRHKESFFRLAQCCQHAEILQGGRITGHFCAACNFFQQPSHDLAAASFRQRFSEPNFVRLRDCADVHADVIAQFHFQSMSSIDTCFHRDKGDDSLAL